MTAWLGRLGTTLLVLAIVASVAHAGARLTWHALGETGTPVPVPVRQTEAPKPPDIAPILDFAPFGERMTDAPVEDAFPVPVPAPTLDTQGLRLTGIILSAKAENSLAMIADGGGPVTSYAVGDAVREGIVLATVGRDHVTLEAGESTATLRFVSPEEARLAGIAKLRTQVPAQFRGPAGGPAALAPPTGLAPAGSTPEAAIDHYRRRIAANPQTVLDDLGITLTGKGYRIGEGAPRAVLRSGLRAGDIVAKVNGERVGDIESDRRLFERIAASGHARVEILRDGRTIVLSFPLR